MRVAISAGVLFGVGGTFEWRGAWFVVAGNVASYACQRLLLNVDLLAERSEVRSGTPRWDRILQPVVYPWGPAASLAVSAVSNRWGWSRVHLSPPLEAACAVAIALCGALHLWSMVSNNWFAKTVRIQKERSHEVCSRGPYAYVRHPGYVAISLLDIAIALLLGTVAGVVVAVLLAAATTLRTALEDRFLHDNLPGYKEFARKTRYRLVPCVW